MRLLALRTRFAEIHLPCAGTRSWEALEGHAREQGYTLPDDPRKLTVALHAMQLGLSLERLTVPELVDERLGLRMGRLFLDDVALVVPRAREGAVDDPGLRAQAAG